MFMDAPLHPLSERFAWMITWFSKMKGAEAYRRRLDGPEPLAAWRYVQRQGRRFAVLVAMWQAGMLPAIAPARPRAAKSGVAKPSRPSLLPRGINWFRKLFPETAAPFSGSLHEMLHGDPQMAELAAATPQAGRIVRPMCRMLGLKPPPYLQLPRRPRRPRPPRPKVVKKLTPEQVDAKVARMSRMAYANMINPNDPDPSGIRPPNRIGYGRPKPWPKPG
jgi:hypothetical protein